MEVIVQQWPQIMLHTHGTTLCFHSRRHTAQMSLLANEPTVNLNVVVQPIMLPVM
jgi:hypothetical protein